MSGESQGAVGATTQPASDDIGPDIAEVVYGTTPKSEAFRAKVLHRTKGDLKISNDGNKFMAHVVNMAKQANMTPRQFIIANSADDIGQSADGTQVTTQPQESALDALFRGAGNLADRAEEGVRETGRSVAEGVADTVGWPMDWRTWNPPQGNTSRRRVDQ